MRQKTHSPLPALRAPASITWWWEEKGGSGDAPHSVPCPPPSPWKQGRARRGAGAGGLLSCEPEPPPQAPNRLHQALSPREKPCQVPCNTGPSPAPGEVGRSQFGQRAHGPPAGECGGAAMSIGDLPQTRGLCVSLWSLEGVFRCFSTALLAKRVSFFYYLFTLYYFLQVLRYYRGGQQREAAGHP